MPLLLHSCCGPCLTGVSPEINDVLAFWDNPNIHPFLEYRSRLESFLKATKILGIGHAIGSEEYGLIRFLDFLQGDYGPDRCLRCYELRLRSTAEKAGELGCEAFSTTLLISPYQKHDLIIAIAGKIAKETGVSFFYRDFRPAFRIGQREALKMELYKQKYCGCIFSVWDRYAKTSPSGRLAGFGAPGTPPSLDDRYKNSENTKK